MDLIKMAAELFMKNANGDFRPCESDQRIPRAYANRWR